MPGWSCGAKTPGRPRYAASTCPPNEALAADQAITTLALALKAVGCPGGMDQLRVRAYLDTLLGKDTRQSLARTPGEHETGGDRDTAGKRARAGHDNRSSEAVPASPGQDDRSTGTTPASPPAWPAGAAAKINLTIPLATLLGLAGHPGEAVGFGPIDADLARAMAAHAAASHGTTWCITVTDSHGHPTAHGCATPGRQRKTSPKKSPGGPPASDRAGPPGGYGTWRLRPVPGGPDLTVTLEPIAVTDCDHRHQTTAHDPSDRLRHLVHIRDSECTWPPCRRAAQRCDFEHAIPWEQGGKTCACNTGPRCRHHHHAKQAAGWHLAQHQPGHHTWTTPSGRTYTTGPTTYPI